MTISSAVETPESVYFPSASVTVVKSVPLTETVTPFIAVPVTLSVTFPERSTVSDSSVTFSDQE